MQEKRRIPFAFGRFNTTKKPISFLSPQESVHRACSRIKMENCQQNSAFQALYHHQHIPAIIITSHLHSIVYYQII